MQTDKIKVLYLDKGTITQTVRGIKEKTRLNNKQISTQRAEKH